MIIHSIQLVYHLPV